MLAPLLTPSFFSLVKGSGEDDEVKVDVKDELKIISSSLEKNEVEV